MFSHVPPNVHNCSAVILRSHVPLQIQITANPKMSLETGEHNRKAHSQALDLWSYYYSSNVLYVLSFALTSFTLKPSFINKGSFALHLTQYNLPLNSALHNRVTSFLKGIIIWKIAFNNPELLNLGSASTVWNPATQTPRVRSYPGNSIEVVWNVILLPMVKVIHQRVRSLLVWPSLSLNWLHLKP